MPKTDENQQFSDDELAELDREIQRIELQRRMDEKNITIKQESGYFEAVSVNALIDEWRKNNADGYSDSRRKKAEQAAAKEGRTLRTYLPATPERRREQYVTSKQKARQDADYAKVEQMKNTEAKRNTYAAMTQAERDEVNRIRREKRAAKKPVL